MSAKTKTPADPTNLDNEESVAPIIRRKSSTDVEKVLLFVIEHERETDDGETETVTEKFYGNKKVSWKVSLKATQILNTHGMGAAVAYMVEAMLGSQQFSALMALDDETLDEDTFGEICDYASTVVTGMPGGLGKAQKKGSKPLRG